LQDAIQRDITTARRAALLKILWCERYLTRDQLIARVDIQFGKNIFGVSAWKDNFYRDMRLVKQAFRAAGLQLQYSRNRLQPGYYLEGQPALSDDFRRILLSSAGEVDSRQIEIYHRSPACERIRQGFSISDTARRVVAYRILQENPDLPESEANRMALQKAYAA